MESGNRISINAGNSTGVNYCIVDLVFSLNSPGEIKTLQTLNAQQKAMISLINSNFTQMVQYLSQERDNALKDRDVHLGDAIKLRRDNSLLREQLTTYTRCCLSGCPNGVLGVGAI